MEIENSSTQTKSIEEKKPQNMLLLQQSILESRIFPVFTLEDALEKMVNIYGEAMILMNSDNLDNGDHVHFSLKSMIDYFSSMENIMYMQKDKSSSTNISNEKYKTQLQSYDKQFVLASLRHHCGKKSAEKSAQIAKLAYENGEDIEKVLKEMGFTE